MTAVASPSTTVRRGLPLLVYEAIVLFLLVLPSIINGILIKYLIPISLLVLAYAFIKKYWRYMVKFQSIFDLQQISIATAAVLGSLNILGISLFKSIAFSGGQISVLQIAIVIDLLAMLLNILEFSSIL